MMPSIELTDTEVKELLILNDKEDDLLLELIKRNLANEKKMLWNRIREMHPELPDECRARVNLATKRIYFYTDKND